VAGNLVAYACKLSFQRGHDGNVSFLSKSQLVEHYEKTLGAFHFGGRIIPNSALGIVMRLYYSIKSSAHEVFLFEGIMNYFKIKNASKCLILQKKTVVIDF
jgi:hypothetical protein